MTNDPIEILIDGEPTSVERDITVAAALFNADVSAVRTSVSGQPRMPLCGMGVCYECRVSIDGVEHVRSCLRLVAPGMRVDTRSRR